MFCCIFTKAIVLKRVVEILNQIVKNVTFECDKNGMHVNCMDLSHVSFVSLFIDPNQLEMYECKKTLNFGIDIEFLIKILKYIENDNALTLSLNNNENELHISTEKGDTYAIKLLDLSEQELEIPETEYAIEFEMDSKTFMKKCESLTIFNDTCVFRIFNNGDITLGSESENGSGNTKLTTINNKNGLNFELNFSLKYLNYFAKGYTLTSKVKIGLSERLPLSIFFKFESGTLLFFLAPKEDGY